MQDVEQDREKRARAAVQSIRRQLPKLFCREGNEEFHCAHMEAETYEVLARLALAGEKEALKILREQIRPLFEAQLYEGRITYLPETVHRLAFEVFLYGPPKTPPGAKGTRTSLRDMTIALNGEDSP